MCFKDGVASQIVKQLEWVDRDVAVRMGVHAWA